MNEEAKRKEEVDKRNGCIGCLVFVILGFCIFYMANNSIDAVKEVSLEELLYLNTATTLPSKLHKARQKQGIRSYEQQGIDVDEEFYDVISNNPNIKNIKFSEGESVSGVCWIIVSMNITSGNPKKPKAAEVEIVFLVKERNLLKLQFARVLGICSISISPDKNKINTRDAIGTLNFVSRLYLSPK